MFILTIPVLAFFYWISSFDGFSKRFFGTLLWMNVLVVSYSWFQSADGEQLAISVLAAIPISIAVIYCLIKALDLGIKVCDAILKRTS
ncbi:hypothetical protein NYR78_03115 [Actinobacillus equuli subsp. haemolyticus]|nr:hypothetical protein NYR78_03115 [Actinobacillus equuli subsp. haemolyticus]